MAESEQALRVLAREDRFSRRVLGRAFKEFLEHSQARMVRSRCLQSLSGVVYVFLTYDSDSNPEKRKYELLGRCVASLSRFPKASTIIGIDINVPGELPRGGYTSDLVMLHSDDGEWPVEYIEKARLFMDELGYFRDSNETRLHEDEYPERKGEEESQ